MTYIPSLTLQQLELLRLVKQHSVGEIQLSSEFPVTDHRNPPLGHPSYIQGLIDARLVQVQVQEMSLRASAFQKESWAKFCDWVDHPTQGDWEGWRKGFINQQEGSISPLMLPGNRFEQFSLVWIRKISLRAVQPGKP